MYTVECRHRIRLGRHQSAAPISNAGQIIEEISSVILFVVASKYLLQ
jgi:hypothetical protein